MPLKLGSDAVALTEKIKLAAIDETINGLEFYVCRRLIGIAEILAREFENQCSTSPLKESGYAILSIVSSYFEMVERFSTGIPSTRGKGEAVFVQGFRKVYPYCTWSKEQIGNVFDRIRCGMYHDGMTRKDTLVSRFYCCGFEICGDELHTNPALVVRDIKQHFCCVFLSRLRDPCSTERRQFETIAAGLGLDMSPPVTSNTLTTQNPADRSS
jgi:hypothetical protein